MTTTLVSVLLVLGAPLVYWTLGLPWVGGAAGRVSLAPLVGCVLAGLFAEWGMMLGVPVPTLTWALLIASAGASAYRVWASGFGALQRAFLEWSPWYAAAVLAASISPFPVIGVWNGDWLSLFRMGEAVFGGDLPASMLARPPLFGAATAPLWLLHGGLIPYQIMAALASAATVSTTLRLLRFLRPNAALWLLTPLLLSPFFLHHNAAAWSKLLAGALVVEAAIEAFRSRKLAAALLYALAVATHEGYIIWAPCLLFCFIAGGRGRLRDALAPVLLMAATGFVIVGPLVLWGVWKYGVEARIAASPAVTQLDSTPFPIRVSLGVLTTFVGWAPVEELVRVARDTGPRTASVLARDLYYGTASWVTTMAGTMAGVLLPFVVEFRRFRRTPAPKLASAYFDRRVLIGVAIAALLNGALVGYNCTWGVMQAAMIPLALAAYAFLMAWLAETPSEGWRPMLRVAGATAVVGTLPWCLLNAGVSVGLWASPRVRDMFSTSSEQDYQEILHAGLQTLGLSAFPGAVLACACLLAGSILLLRRERAALISSPDLPSSDSANA